jgi:predicted MFS family arabinose efflux permease
MPLSRPRAWLLAVVATLAMSVSYADRQVVAAVGASVRAGLHISAASFGLLASAFSLSYLVVTPLAGAVADRLGARRTLSAAILAWSAVSMLHALVPSFAALLVLRVLLGLTEAPSFPSAAQTVRRALPRDDRSAAFGLLFTGSSLGAAIVAPLAIRLDVVFGWRVAFVVASAVGLTWLPAWLLVTRSRDVRELLRHAEPQAESSATEPSANRWRELGTDPAVLRALLLVLASAPGLMFMFVWLPQYLELGRGLAKSELPHLVWLPPLMADAGMIGFGLLASMLDRRSEHPRSHVQLVLVAAALEATLVLVPWVAGTWPAVFVVGLSAMGGGGLYVLLTADMMSRVDPRHAATAGGMTAAAQSLVYVVFNPLVGRWIDRTGSFDGPIVSLGLVALPGAIVWSLWPVDAGARQPPK